MLPTAKILNLNMKPLAWVVLLSAIMVMSGCGRKAQEQYEDVRPVRAVVVGRTSGTVGATYSGEIRARYESKPGFRISGKVIARLIEVGTHVGQGQPLLRLDPQDVALNVASAAAQVDAAKSRVTQNRVDLERAKQLFNKHFISQAELDQQKLSLEESESQLKSAEAQQQIAMNQREYTTLTADRAGVVTAINVEVGQVVSAGQPVLTIAADGEREVVVSIPESRVDELRNAKTMTVSLWANPGKTYTARLRELAPDTDDVTRTYAARVTVRDADAALRLGMTASVYVPDVEGVTAIRLPLTAVYNKEGQPLVWVVDPQTSQVKSRAVKLAAAQNDTVLVADGLKDGEIVVTAGVHMLHPGQKVKFVDSLGVPATGIKP